MLAEPAASLKRKQLGLHRFDGTQLGEIAAPIKRGPRVSLPSRGDVVVPRDPFAGDLRIGRPKQRRDLGQLGVLRGAEWQIVGSFQLDAYAEVVTGLTTLEA